MSKINSKLSLLNKKLDNPIMLSRRRLLGISLLSVLVIAAGVILIIHPGNLFGKPKHSAAVPVDSCAAASTITYSCYKNLLGNITAKQGPEAAIALIKQQYNILPYVKSQCHQLTHVVGRAAVIKYGDLGQTYVHGDHFCASGYFHGASEEIVTQKGVDYMAKNANQICAVFAKKEHYSLNHYNCVHGLGHGFMEAYNGELFQALKACDALNDEWERSSCYSGVFMQNIMITQSPDESADHTSKYLKPEDPMYPCNAVDNKYKSGCYIIQTSYALPVVGYDYAKVFALCAPVSSDYRDTCYQSIGRDASGLQGYDPQKTKKTCLLGQDLEARQNCVIGAAKDIVYNYHTDRQAYSFCGMFENDIQISCRATVKDYSRF
ncbi:MAG: exported protein of unknown function [Candidatus Saccharibacteria bacterium]|nr:exported protein of unknown function [Candidatus Saccharibacteria bacterium]